MVNAARKLKGVPYHHQGRNPEFGLDCVGYVLAVYNQFDLDFELPMDYTRTPRPKQLKENLAKYCDIVPTMEVGDILLMIPRKLPQHLALYVGNNYIIHSYSSIGKVVEHQLDKNYKIDSINRLKSHVVSITNNTTSGSGR